MTDDGATLVSTTADPAELSAAMAHARFGGTATPDTPTPADTPVSTPAAEPASDDADVSADASAAAASKAGKELAKRKESYQQRIDRLTYDNYATQRERDQAVAQVQQLREELARMPQQAAAQAQAPNATAAPAIRPKPKVTDFADYEAFVEDLTNWTAENVAQKMRAEFSQTVDQRWQQTQQQQAAELHQRQIESIVASHTQRVEAAKAILPDFDAVTQQAAAELFVPPHINAHLLHSELGPQLQYYLATHPAETREISGLPWPLALARLGRVEASLLSQASAAPSGPVTPAPPITSAAPPIKPVGTSPAAPVGTAEVTDIDVYVAARRPRRRA